MIDFRCFVGVILQEQWCKSLYKTGPRAEIKADGQMDCFQCFHSCHDGQSGSQRRVLPHTACWVNWSCRKSSFLPEFSLRAPSQKSAILIIAQINEVRELASVLHLAASVQSRAAGGHAPKHTGGSESRVWRLQLHANTELLSGQEVI